MPVFASVAPPSVRHKAASDKVLQIIEAFFNLSNGSYWNVMDDGVLFYGELST